MADKQDNRTEQRLQDYARRRREQQGPAPQMHDATRRLLHGEVQRTWGQTVPAEETSGGWESWLLKFATGTVAVGALALGVWVTFDSGEQVTNRAENMGSLMKITKTDPAQPVGERGVSEQQNGAEDLQTTRRDNNNKVSVAAGAKKSEQLKAPAADAATGKQAGNEPATNQRDAQLQDAVPEAVRQPVMQNFEVIQNDDTIQVRDKDGSVYEGRVIFASATPVIGRVTFASAMPVIAAATKKGISAGTKPAPKPNPTFGGRGLPSIVSDPRNLGKKSSTIPPPSKNLRPLLPDPEPPVHPKINPAVPNDNVETAIRITELNKPLLGHNMHATRQPGRETRYPNFHGHSVWYLFKAPADGVATISTRGSNVDTTLGVFTGSTPGTIALEADMNGLPAWNNDQPNAPWSKVSFPCEAGREYRVAVDGVGGSTGQIKLTTRVTDATGRVLSTFSARKANSVATRRANDKKPLFYFQVAGTNRTSKQPVQFEGFVRSAPAGEKEDARQKDSPNEQRGRSVAAAPLRIQGRASYGRQRLTVDAFTASAAPTQKK